MKKAAPNKSPARTAKPVKKAARNPKPTREIPDKALLFPPKPTPAQTLALARARSRSWWTQHAAPDASRDEFSKAATERAEEMRYDPKWNGAGKLGQIIGGVV